MMVIGIMLLVLAGLLAFVAISFDDQGKAFCSGVATLLAIIVGGVTLYQSAVGEICTTTTLSNSPIYKVLGTVDSPKGQIVIIQNGNEKIYAVFGPAPQDAKFVVLEGIKFKASLPVGVSEKPTTAEASQQPQPQPQASGTK